MSGMSQCGGANRLDYQKLLRGHYELDNQPKDLTPQRIVPDFAFNVLNPLGLLYRPVVDEDYLAKGGTKPLWPEKRPFAVCLSHDVDLVSLSSFRQMARMRAHNFMSGVSLRKRARSLVGFGLDVARAIADACASDPLHCVERWLEVEKKVGARSTFFFWPGWSAVGKHHPSDCLYEMEDRVVFDGQWCTVAEMIREIHHRGWEIGLHPSWYSFDDIGEMKRQKESLEIALGHDVQGVRQHYLHYDIRVTPRIQAAAGFKYDSSLGFNDNIGFRFGTCRPWHLYDLQADEQLPIVELPLIIQDGALFHPDKGMRLDKDMAFQYLELITEAVKKVGGVMTLLWHPHAILYPGWWGLYDLALKHLQDQNAWLRSARDVVQAYFTSCGGSFI